MGNLVDLSYVPDNRELRDGFLLLRDRIQLLAAGQDELREDQGKLFGIIKLLEERTYAMAHEIEALQGALKQVNRRQKRGGALELVVSNPADPFITPGGLIVPHR
jgi:hypothetical protein